MTFLTKIFYDFNGGIFLKTSENSKKINTFSQKVGLNT